MKHETKLGLVFIGILLTIFVALLMKRLSRPGNAVLANARQPAATAANEPSKLAHQPGPPTLVTPKAQSGKAPESVAAESHEKHSPAVKLNHPVAQDPPASSPATRGEQAPSLIATPLPVAEVGDRYANKPHDPLDTSAPSSSNSSSAQPHRSAYADTNDNRGDPSPTRLEPDQPSREKSDSRSAGQRYSDTTVNEPRRSEPRQQADRYSTPSRAAELYPIAANETPVAQRYPSANIPVASTGAITPAGIKRDGDKYTVEPNDSFWIISEKAYGSGAFFKALYEHNRKLHMDADEMRVGQVLSVPDESVLRRNYPDLCPAPRKQVAAVQQRLTSASGRMRGTGRIYTVEDGDTLFEIARHELGKTSRWAEIYDLNREVLGNDFDYLKPGLELILPDDKQRGENVTRQPDNVYPR